MFRPYPQIRPPVNGLTAFRDPFAWLRWFWLPGPALIVGTACGYGIALALIWLIRLAVSAFHHCTDFN
jgi:hypothetical protein